MSWLYKCGVGRMISIILCFLILTNIFTLNTFAADKNTDYAEIVFGSSLKLTNLECSNFSYLPDVKKQKPCSRSDLINGVYHVYINIEDDFIFNLPNETPVDITVEYFDGDEGKFNIAYDSTEPALAWSGVENNTIYNETEAVYLTNTQEWKKHTFHIENLRAANNIGGSDFRLSIWSPTSAYSKKDVYFASLKIEWSKYLNPLRVTEVGMGVTGNTMSETDDITLTAQYRNKSEENVSATISGGVYDAEENLLQSLESVSFDVKELEEGDVSLKLGNPKIYGLYKVKGRFDIHYASEPDKVITQEFETKFSVSHVFDKESINTEFGACSQVVAHGRGEPQPVSDVMIAGGMSFVRDDIGGGTNEGGTWVLPEENVAQWRTIAENGVEIIGILFGPQTFGAWNIMPETDEQIKTYAEWCGDVAAQLKGIVDYLEIWNEPNISGFNANNLPGEIYGKMCAEAYKEIKKANPDAVVLGISSAAMDGLNIDYKWTKATFDGGGYEGMDALSIHPYDWSGIFRDELFIESANILHELMREYGEEKPVYITEFGFSSYDGQAGYTRKEQAQNHVLARAISKAYGLYDKYIFYCLADRGDRDEIEDNWGIINNFDSTYEDSPYSAKESFIAMTAYNHFITDTTVLKDNLSKERVYVFNFYNDKLGKNVMLMQTGDEYEPGEAHKSFKLGCSSAELYDSYGNKLSDLYSENGVYSFIIDEEPVYVVGNFSGFSETEEEAVVKTEKGAFEAVGGDILTVEFEKSTPKELFIEAVGVEVSQNSGFEGNKAQLELLVPSDGRTEENVMIKISDKDGKVYYCRNHIINITSPISVSFESVPAMKLSNSYWYVNAKIKNLGNSVNLNGTFEITEPEKIAEINTQRSFSQLCPGEEITFTYKLPEKVNKNVINLKAKLSLDTGHEEYFENKLNFTSAAYAYKKPVIDGNADSGEWTGSWVGADEAKDVREINNWNGASDVSFSGTMMWDEENFYFLGIGTDDVHFIQYDGGVSKMWRADSFQIAFDDRESINPVEDQEFTELGLGEVPGEGSRVYRTKSLYDLPVSIAETAEIAVKRHNQYTIYECRIPWDEIFYKDYILNPDTPFRFSVLLNDNDGDGRGWIEYMSGIGNPKAASMFGEVTFNK